jgi:hypothetical protein
MFGLPALKLHPLAAIDGGAQRQLRGNARTARYCRGHPTLCQGRRPQVGKTCSVIRAGGVPWRALRLLRRFL